MAGAFLSTLIPPTVFVTQLPATSQTVRPSVVAASVSVPAGTDVARLKPASDGFARREAGSWAVQASVTSVACQPVSGASQVTIGWVPSTFTVRTCVASMFPAMSSAWKATDVCPSAVIVTEPFVPDRSWTPGCAPEVWMTIRWMGMLLGLVAVKLTVTLCRVQPDGPGAGAAVAVVAGGCGGRLSTSNSRVLDTIVNSARPVSAATFAATRPGSWSQSSMTAAGSESVNTRSGMRAGTLYRPGRERAED